MISAALAVALFPRAAPAEDPPEKPVDLNAPLQAEIKLAPEPPQAPARRKPAWLFTSDGANPERLWSQTKLMLGLGVTTAGVLYLMPEGTTGWDHDYKISDLPSRWWENVSNPPEWDSNDWFFNYVTHPYCGGVYYIMARKSGYSQRDSFVYSALMSTFFWEYGFEAFAERPSKQDLVVTPVCGWLYGEWAYHREQAIIANGGRVMGSHILGSISRFLLDPMDSLGRFANRVTGRDWVITGDMSVSALSVPRSGNETFYKEDHPDVTIRLAIRF